MHQYVHSICFMEHTHLAFKILSHKLERVVERMDGRKLNIRGRFVFAGTMDNGSQDLICPER
jgi:hypothetical protein